MIRAFRFAGGAIFGVALIGGALVVAHLPGAPRTVAAAVITSLPTAEIAAADQPAPGASTTSADPSRDPAVDIARARALATLDQFLVERDLPGVTAASLLVTVPAPDLPEGLETVWMSRCRETNPGRFTCIVDDSPSTRRLRLGDRHAFSRDDIVDWKYVDGRDRIHGGYTIRAALPAMEANERAAIIPRLAPLPAG